MQFGAIHWPNFKENYCKFLTFFTVGTNKGCSSLYVGAEAYFRPPYFWLGPPAPASYAYVLETATVVSLKWHIHSQSPENDERAPWQVTVSCIDSGKLYLSKSTLQVVTYGWKVFYTSSLDGYFMYWNWGMIRSNVYDIDKKKEHFKLWSEKNNSLPELEWSLPFDHPTPQNYHGYYCKLRF